MRDNPNMESFYVENAAHLSGQAPIIVTTTTSGHHMLHQQGGGVGGGMHGPSNGLKRPLTLDLNGKDLSNGQQPTPKRFRFNTSVNGGASVISTPDVELLKLASPELNKYLNGSSLQTPTPNVMFPKNVS